MQCIRCGAQNPDEKKYCGDCGALLNTLEELKIREQALAVFEEQFKRRDQKLLAIETVDAVYARLKAAVVPIALAIAILGLIGYGKYNSLLGSIKAAETDAVRRLRGQTEEEAKHIRDEASAQRALLQTSAEKETAALRVEANSMRAENAKSSEELQAEVKRTKAKLGLAQTEIVQLLQQGTTLKEKYDGVGTQLASLQDSTPRSNTVALTEALNTSGLISATALKFYSVGSSGTEVKQIQNRLKELGCYDGDVTGQ